MQSIFNIRSAYGLPLCLSGVTRFHHLSLSTQIADHDRRRNEMKRAKTENRNVIPAEEIDGEVTEIEVVMIRSPDLMMFNLDNHDHDDDCDRDHDQSSLCYSKSCAAKAA
ncbi:hypothetical protein HanPI659440_Chr13g0486171 [Helianthus annuus]|nr:hypothetical protein HanPI659440_Chr13g0486171 [Helianthus annuus]